MEKKIMDKWSKEYLIYEALKWDVEHGVILMPHKQELYEKLKNVWFIELSEVEKVYIGKFSCPDCPSTIDNLPFKINDMEMYCDICNTNKSMILIDVKLKI